MLQRKNDAILCAADSTGVWQMAIPSGNLGWTDGRIDTFSRKWSEEPVEYGDSRAVLTTAFGQETKVSGHGRWRW